MRIYMDFENFSVSRDLLYLASLFAGAGAGGFLAAFGASGRGRGGWITAALCFLSCAVAALSGSIVFSMGAVFTAFPLFIPAAVFFAAGVLGIRFPRLGAGIVLAAGVFTVFAAAGFLRYPGFAAPELPAGAGRSVQMSVQSSGGGIVIRGTRNPGGLRQDETWNLPEGNVPGILYFEAVAFVSDPRYPVFGGEKRGFFTGSGRGDEKLFSIRQAFFTPPPAGEMSLSGTAAPSKLGFTPAYFRAELPGEALFPGVNVSVLFDGDKITFDPPIVIPDRL
ncbi:MAG: hypothetical protein LBI67_04135 [Treponema sp.]|jgi:prepilin signal peptidase PulO-like enzyme (type II secretory pathway)|nr:hypothetical protein [Treponema sp.]